MGERIHPPSVRKLAQARQNGQVWRATLLVQAIGIIIFSWIAVSFKTMVLEVLHNLLELMGQPQLDVIETLKMGVVVSVGFVIVALSFVALSCSLLTCAFGGVVVSTKAISVDMSRIDPVAGLVRIGTSIKDSWQILLRLVISILVLGGLICFSKVSSTSLSTLNTILNVSFLTLLGIGCLDAFFKRRKFMLDQRMTEEELRRESRDTEGDPLMKAMQRSIRESLSRGEMISRLKRAKVLVVRRTLEQGGRATE